MNKIVLLAKTNINIDGRILNQLSILKEWNKDLKVDLILLPDQKVTISFDDSVKLHQIDTIFKYHNKFARFYTLLDFTFKAFKLLNKLKPSIIHAHDAATVLPVLLYRLLHPKKFYLIYDDYEVPNEKEPFRYKIMNPFENILIKMSDTVIEANEERILHLKKKITLKNNIFYFLNLPYYNYTNNVFPSSVIESKLDEIESRIKKGTEFIIHQGRLEIERGRQKLADLCKNLPKPYEILLLGGTEADFIKFKKENNLHDNKFLFIGSINYEVLPLFWKKGYASIVMYLPTLINNRLCAPNRLYLSYFMGLPIIANKNNPVLYDFVDSYNAGGFIEDFMENNNIDFFNQLNNLIIDDSAKERLLDIEKGKIIDLYSSIIDKQPKAG